jgi:hypothetical protein
MGPGVRQDDLAEELHSVIARSEATKQSRVACVALDCFAEPVIGPRFARTGWLVMTVERHTFAFPRRVSPEFC